MEEQTNKEAVSIIKELNSPETTTAIESIKKINAVDDLRLHIFSFFKARLDTVARDEILKKAVEEKLLEKIANNELTVVQLMQLARGLRNDTTMAIDSLLSILKPVPNTTNPLMDKAVEEESEPFEDLSNRDKKDLETLARFFFHGFIHQGIGSIGNRLQDTK